jgi:hypothetical protein
MTADAPPAGGGMAAMRYPMRIDPVWLPMLALFGGTPGRSYVELTDGTVRFRFGWLFDYRVPRREIAGASRTTWSLLGGIGWRLALGGRVGLIGSLANVVEVRLDPPRWIRVVFVPWRCRRICVSVVDPDALLAALRR